MSVSEILKDAEHKMKGAIEAMTHDFASYRTGRASPAVLDRVHVEYYGAETPINQIANITTPEPRQLLIQPWEKKMVAVVEKAIRESDLGLNPATQGDLIRVPMPALTEERRRELTKVVRSEGETAKVAVRNLRRDANEQLKKLVKDKEISEDDERRASDEVQKLTDKYVAEIDKLVHSKEAEIMTV